MLLRTILGVLGLSLVVVASGSAAGELLRCKGPEGETVFTDPQSVCPEAELFVPKG